MGVRHADTGAIELTLLGAIVLRCRCDRRSVRRCFTDDVGCPALMNYGALNLAERDVLGSNNRALPPAEHHVVVAWYETEAQLAWTRTTGLANVRLGDRPGSWQVPPEISSARHLLLRTHRRVVAPGLFRLRSPGYRVFTATDLLRSGYPGTAGGEIYAVFEVDEDSTYAGRRWDGSVLMRVLNEFERRGNYGATANLGRRSADPRVLSLRDLLKALK